MDSREEDSLRNNSARADRVSFLSARFYCVPSNLRVTPAICSWDARFNKESTCKLNNLFQ